MRYLFWNIYGFGHVGRKTQLKVYMRNESVYVVALQETIKSDFRHHYFLSSDPLERFVWRCTLVGCFLALIMIAAT